MVCQVEALKTVIGSYDHTKITEIAYHKILKIPSTKVDGIVENLIQRFNAPQYRPLFRKACWRLPEGTIYAKLERAQQSPNPLAYFIVCLKNELNRKAN